MIYTKTLLPGESVPELVRKMSLVTDIYLEELRLRAAQSQPEVVGSSERGCNSSTSASVTRAGHLRPLDVQRGFGMLPDGQGLLGGGAEPSRVGSRIPLRLRGQKGGIPKRAVQKRVR
jgi:hypothetical protein